MPAAHIPAACLTELASPTTLNWAARPGGPATA